MYANFVVSILFGSWVIAFVCGMFAVITLPHWRRLAYGGLLLALPVVAGAVVAVVWRHEAPHLFWWGMRYIGAHGVAQLFGGLAGMEFGRPLGRLAVRAFLPSGARTDLAFLWLVDGKPFPRW
jgi:hypothetical protein